MRKKIKLPEVPEKRIYRGTCPDCGKIEMFRKFTFCPDCGKPIKESDWNSKPIKATRRPTKVNKILEDMGLDSEAKKKELLNSIRYSPDRSNVISGNVGRIKQ